MHSTVEFRQKVLESKYPELKTSVRLISVFSTEQCCEFLFSLSNEVRKIKTSAQP